MKMIDNDLWVIAFRYLSWFVTILILKLLFFINIPYIRRYSHVYYIVITSRRICRCRCCLFCINVNKTFSTDFPTTYPPHPVILYHTTQLDGSNYYYYYCCCYYYYYCYYVSICTVAQQPAAVTIIIISSPGRANETIGFPERLSTRIWLIHFNRVVMS